MAKTAKRSPGRPATGLTPKRYFRMGDESYALVVQAAKRKGETASAFIRRVLLRDARAALRQHNGSSGK